MAQAAPKFCPKCGKLDPEETTTFPVDGSEVHIYRCRDCGYLFQVIEVLPKE